MNKYKPDKNWKTHFVIACFIILVLANVFSTYVIVQLSKAQVPAEPLFVAPPYKDPNVTTCATGILGLDVKCMVESTETWYSYNVTQHPASIGNESYMRTNGGDCKDWSMYYAREFRKRGYSTDYIRYYLTDYGYNAGHQLLFVYNDEGYCYVDQTKYDCTKISITA